LTSWSISILDLFTSKRGYSSSTLILLGKERLDAELATAAVRLALRVLVAMLGKDNVTTKTIDVMVDLHSRSFHLDLASRIQTQQSSPLFHATSFEQQSIYLDGDSGSHEGAKDKPSKALWDGGRQT
jgi:hypothetical protein